MDKETVNFVMAIIRDESLKELEKGKNKSMFVMDSFNKLMTRVQIEVKKALAPKEVETFKVDPSQLNTSGSHIPKTTGTKKNSDKGISKKQNIKLSSDE